jgi:hypothetical protein
MSEVILFAPIVPAQSSTVPDYNLFYKNAHVPFWQNGLIASYTPENWTGSSWVNGNFGTLPVTTLTGTTTKVASANYQNIFTNLSGGAQTSARAIFSFRRVNTLYIGPNFRIRRSSDNFVQAFYADGAGKLGTAIGATGQPLLDWLGGSIAYVETWYDQSLNVRHATQTTWTLQPSLSLAKLAVDFTGTTFLSLPTGTVPMQTPYTIVARHEYIGGTSGAIISAGTTTTNQGNSLLSDATQGYLNSWNGNNTGANLGAAPIKDNTVTVRYDGPTTAGTTYFFVNGVQTNTGARTSWAGVSGNESIGAINSAGGYTPGFAYIGYSGYHGENPTYTSTVTTSGTTTSTATLSAATGGFYIANSGQSNFSVVWTGYYLAPTTGTYTFTLNSDDGAYLWINTLSGFTTGNALVNDGGSHGMVTISNTIGLTAGQYYYVRVLFGQGGGGYDMYMYVTPPAGTQTDLGSVMYQPAAVSNPLNGKLYDCFIFASALSDADRTSIENVLMNSSSALPTLYGPTSASITWPTGIVPSTYSMFHLAKYQKPSQGNNRRILQGLTTNWLSGFWSGYSGVAFHNGFLTQSVASAHGTDWVLSTDQNSLYRSLGRTRGTTGAGTPSFDTLAINAGNSPVETTDFTFQAMMVYNRTLNATEYQMVEDYLANRFKIPVPPQESLALSLDASDYFTSGGTTWPDRSPNGRNFTLSATGAYVSTDAFPYMNFTANRATIATAVPSATYNTLIVFGTIRNSTGNWRGLIFNGNVPIMIESGTNRLGSSYGAFYPCDQNVDVSTLDQVYTRFNMHVWKLSSVSPYYQYYFNPNMAPCRPTGVITDSRMSYTSGFTTLGDNGTSGQYWGNLGTVLYYNRDLSDQELVETYQRHMTKYLLPTPFVPMSPVPNGYVITRSGMYTPGTGVTALKVLVIAGGGGGGGGFQGGGGGAGGLLFSGFYYVTAGVPIQVIIGQGGRGTRRNSLPENGGDTIFGTMRAIGGGSGAAEQTTASIGPAAVIARSGGSGGGGSWGAPTGNSIFPPGDGTTGQGNMGGAGFGSPFIGGGGGGAATPGFDASFAYAGNGGDGRSWTMMGVTNTYCGGGGGSLRGSGTSSGGLGGGGGGNGSGTGANATYYGSGGGAGGGNGVACMGGDGFQGIVLVEVNVDPYPTPVLQNPGNQNFQAGGAFNINQTVTGIADITWVLTQVYNAPNLVTPANQSFTNGGVFTVTNITNSYLTGALVWTINPTTGISLVSNTSTSATFQCGAYPGISSVSYVVTATGPSGAAGSTSGFIITNTSTYLYNFSTFTFTPMGATGRSGPTAITYGASTPGFGTGSVMTLGSGTSTGMQLWVVPSSGNYVFTVAGARGGNGTQAGGNGAVVAVTLALTQGHVLRLLPGQIGTTAVSGCGITKAGGGGGSFVYNNNTSTILIAAGGGGGGSGGPIVTPGLRDASLTTSGKKGDGSSGGAGGTSGNGGLGGSPACTNGAGGGGGWSGNGGNGAGYNGNLGLSLINGGTGGFNDNEGTTNGGFGGAGAAGAHPGGGGGGYSGGGGGTLQTCNCGDTQVGGGGGSYATVAFTSSSVTNTGAGYITIALANPAIPVLTNPGTQSLATGSSAQTITVLQTSSTTSTGAITWTYSTLPSGMTVTSSSGTQIVFSVAQNTTISSQTFIVTATSANAPATPTSVSFTLVAGVNTGVLASMTGTAWTSANAVYGVKALYSSSATILTVRRSSDNVTVNVIADTTGNYTVSTGGTYATWIGASTGYVTQWWDQSGKNAHATQSTTGSQPIFNTASKFIDFKTTAWFSMPNGTVPFNNTNYTIVTKHNTINNNQGCLWGSGGYGTVRYVNALERAGGNYAQYWWGDDAGASPYAVGNIVTSKYNNTVGRTIYVNGTSAGTNNSLLRNSTNVNNTIACDWRGGGAGVFLNGELYYLQIYGSVFSDSDRGVAESVTIT